MITKLGRIFNLYRLSLRRSCEGVEVLLIRTSILGNEVLENRNGYCTKVLRNSQNIRSFAVGPIEISRCLDGGHITCLLTALFLRHLPELVKAGKIYTAVPPLYRVQRKKETIYCYSDEELKAVAKKTDEVTRFKGLGEMSPAELYDTTMNPDKRHLIQLTTEDFDNTMDLYETLMGTSAKARRDFILANKLSKLDKDDVDLFDSEGDDE